MFTKGLTETIYSKFKWKACFVFFLILLFALTYPLALIGQNSPKDIQFAGGNGTAGNPYLIANVDHLQAIRNMSNAAHFKLIADINASATVNWNIGQELVSKFYSGNILIVTLFTYSQLMTTFVDLIVLTIGD